MSKHITSIVRASDKGSVLPEVSATRPSQALQDHLAPEQILEGLSIQAGEADNLPKQKAFLPSTAITEISIADDAVFLSATEQYYPVATNAYTPVVAYSGESSSAVLSFKSATAEPVLAAPVQSVSASPALSGKLLGGLMGAGVLGGLGAAGGGGGGGGNGNAAAAEKAAAEKAAAEKAAAEKTAAEKAAAEKAAAEKAAAEKAAAEKAAAEKAAAEKAAAEKAAAEKAAAEKAAAEKAAAEKAAAEKAAAEKAAAEKAAAEKAAAEKAAAEKAAAEKAAAEKAAAEKAAAEKAVAEKAAAEKDTAMAGSADSVQTSTAMTREQVLAEKVAASEAARAEAIARAVAAREAAIAKATAEREAALAQRAAEKEEELARIAAEKAAVEKAAAEKAAAEKAAAEKAAAEKAAAEKAAAEKAAAEKAAAEKAAAEKAAAEKAAAEKAAAEKAAAEKAAAEKAAAEKAAAEKAAAEKAAAEKAAAEKAAAEKAAAEKAAAEKAAAEKAAAEKAAAEKAAAEKAAAEKAAAEKAAAEKAAAEKAAAEKAAAEKAAAEKAAAEKAAAEKAAAEKAAAEKSAAEKSAAEKAAAEKAAAEKAAAEKAAAEKAAAEKAAAEKAAAEKAAAEKAAAEKAAAEKAAAEKAAAEKAAAEKDTAMAGSADSVQTSTAMTREQVLAEKVAASEAARAEAIARAVAAREAAIAKATAEREAVLAQRAAEKEEELARIAAEKAAVEKAAAERLAAELAPIINNPTLVNKTYTIHTHETYGKYIDASEFGTDQSGESDSLNAIKSALLAAHAEGTAVYLSGNLYISDQIKIDESLNNVKGLFGDGMGETVISFDKAQTGVFNPDTNHDDIREFAGILVDHVDGVTIAELSVVYTNDDFYRAGQSYFGKVNGIQINDSDHTLISKVEVSGANRAGVAFSSTDSLTREDGYSKTYKERAATGEIDETYANLPLGENNRIIDSYLHHNRVAGALVSYQKNFVAENNLLSWNGHEADGGTGYGITAMAGSYNYGITFIGNTTDHNYRKGLDVHDGTDIVISNNTSNGDRLYGIAVYNRQFAMDKVEITDNIIIQDAAFRLDMDDDQGARYHVYSGIQLMTNTQQRELNTDDNAVYVISGNEISGLAVYKGAQQTYGIEFRNYERDINYTVDITDNTITGETTRYIIGILNDTRNPKNGDVGAGSGVINITGNTADIGEIIPGSVALYVEEKATVDTLRGSVTVSDNDFTIGKSNGYIEVMQLLGNAETYTVSDNSFTLGGKIDKALISIIGKTSAEPTATVSDNNIQTDLSGNLSKGWIEMKNVSYIALENQHNGSEIDIASNMIAEKIIEIVARHEAADLEKTWESDSSGLDFSSLLSADGSAQGGISEFGTGSEAAAYDVGNETMVVDTSTFAYL